MDYAWKENVIYQVKRACKFYNPANWDDNDIGIWLDALQGLSSEKILAAFQTYYKTGKYMPKPAEIIAIVQEVITPSHKKFEKQDDRKCDPVIASAWRIYLSKFLGWDFGAPKIELSDADVIEIVNREAAKYDQPGAVRPIHRIQSFWSGKNYDPDDWWSKFSTEH